MPGWQFMPGSLCSFWQFMQFWQSMQFMWHGSLCELDVNSNYNGSSKMRGRADSDQTFVNFCTLTRMAVYRVAVYRVAVYRGQFIVALRHRYA
jgi:hypothetical protein